MDEVKRVRVLAIWQEPAFLRRFHLGMTFVFLSMIPVALFTPLQQSVPFLVAISLWALVASHWAAWQSARVEVRQVDADPTLDERGMLIEEE
jgi:hypothetical protein